MRSAPRSENRLRLSAARFSLLFLIGLTAVPCLAQNLPQPAQYLAEYEVRYKGRRVARAEFSVTEDADGAYVFNSSTRARGLLRLASPNPAIERSRFAFDSGSIRPIRFLYEDGSRKGEDNYSVDFDRKAGKIRIDGANGMQSLPLEADLLDRGSLQVALMRDLSACKLPKNYRYVDDDGINEYSYARLEDQSIETGIGELSSLRLSQQREGSSRQTILSLSPELGFLPIRIEQIRDGETETVFLLEDFSGPETPAADCSGFR